MKKLLITTICLILCLATTIGLTYAYFTDYEAAKGGAIIHLGGRTETEEEFDGNNKNISIKNTGDVDMVVRVKVFGDEKRLVIKSVTSGDWVDGGDGYWYYTHVLKANKNHDNATSVLKAEVTAGLGPGSDVNFDIVVAHESSRVVYGQSGGNEVVVLPDGWSKSVTVTED